MQRTQVYLTDEQGRLFEEPEPGDRLHGVGAHPPAIDGVYAPRHELTTADRIRLARRTAGAWKEFPETGAEYVERIRGSRRWSQQIGRS